MSSLELASRLQFLQDAAHLLLLPAPETSRHLMLKHDSLMSEHNLNPSDERQNSCGACGTIMVVGWEGRLDIEYVRTKRKKGKQGDNEEKRDTIGLPTPKASKTMSYTCDSCRRTTRFPMDLPTKPARYNPSSRRPQPSKIPLEKPSTTSSTTTSNVKKRTKAKKGGLAAILAKQKESQTSSTGGFGLDLMDFMKKS